MAICCPNKKGLTYNEQSPVVMSGDLGSTSSSVPSQDLSEKHTENGLNIRSGKGTDSNKISKVATVQFCAKTPHRLERPRSISPKKDSNGRSHRPDLRYTTPRRTNHPSVS